MEDSFALALQISKGICKIVDMWMLPCILYVLVHFQLQNGHFYEMEQVKLHKSIRRLCSFRWYVCFSKKFWWPDPGLSHQLNKLYCPNSEWNKIHLDNSHYPQGILLVCAFSLYILQVGGIKCSLTKIHPSRNMLGILAVSSEYLNWFHQLSV